MSRNPPPARPDPRQPWQIEQAARCGCKGTDDMCACQNEIEGTSVTPARRIRELEGAVRTLELQQQTDRQTIASLASAHEAAEAELAALRAQAPADQVQCLARKSSGPDPQDCDWPHCGCDPKAERVLEALVEEGWQPPPRAQAPTPVAIPLRAPPVCRTCNGFRRLPVVESCTQPAHEIDCPVCVGIPLPAART